LRGAKYPAAATNEVATSTPDKKNFREPNAEMGVLGAPIAEGKSTTGTSRKEK